MDELDISQFADPAVSAALLVAGGGAVGAWMKYRLGAKRIDDVDAHKAAAEAFAMAMNAQSQLNDRMGKHLDAVQQLVSDLQRRVEDLTRENMDLRRSLADAQAKLETLSS